MKRFLFAIAFAVSAGAALAQPASDGDGRLLRPVEEWVVDFSDTHCTAARTYGSEEEPVVLAFRPSVAEDVVRVTIIRPARSYGARRSDVTVTFLDARIEATGLRFPTGDRTREVTWINLDDPAIERLQLAGQVTIAMEGVSPLSFQLEEMPAVVQLLRECNDDLRAHWNVGESARVEIEQRAEATNASRWVGPGDYPAQAMQEGVAGTVSFILMVDETGTVKDCSVEGTSGSALLDATSCVRLIERARFRPARDADGNPVRSVYRRRIRWSM